MTDSDDMELPEPAAWKYSVGSGNNYFVTREKDRGSEEYWDPLDARSSWVSWVKSRIDHLRDEETQYSWDEGENEAWKEGWQKALNALRRELQEIEDGGEEAQR